MIKLYLRRERTTESVAVAFYTDSTLNKTRFQDVVAYADEACTKFIARWPWHYSRKPRKNSRRVMLDCYWWKPVWV